MKKTLAPLTIMAVFLSACSNRRIIEDAMQSIGSQSTYINTVEPKWPLAMTIVFGILAVLFLALLAVLIWSMLSYKKAKRDFEKAKKSRPARRVTKVYYPQPLHPGDQHQSVTYAPTQAHPQYPPEHVPVQPPWRRT